jgi:pimeloyl-ACP methyl ester carboxylesterase
MEDKFLDLSGIHTRYREQGSGPPLILLHGAALGTSVEVWENTMPALASRGLHVLAVEWPGWGLTDWPESHSPGDRPGHLLRFMDEKGIEKAALVGHSMSGGVVVNMAFSHPDRVSHIIVLGTGTLLPPLPRQANARWRRARRSRAVARGHPERRGGQYLQPCLPDARADRAPP